MSFFIENKELFKLQPEEGNGLRKCQLGAIWALKSHYTTSSNDIASLISMPTGSGKTALMMATCFELNLQKILNELYKTNKISIHDGIHGKLVKIKKLKK
ncbi:DEAD/DEAH box helicase family protein [Tenacibaculum sp. C7A-26P2]|uniref:DEAD/DEAH box helicase family protein n=1 Tax=Tenacibaculum sp. C7A-26P2 TaxID=3447504 RepID=UPI003F837BBD